MICLICHKEYTKTANNQKYCTNCRVTVKKQQRQEYNQRRERGIQICHVDSDAGYESFANGIVKQAVADYRECLKRLKKTPNNEIWLAKKVHIEKFFNSGWFRELTNVDAIALLEKLNAEG